MKTYKANASQPRLETHDGQEYLVVPVVMARAGVEMNGATITEDDLHAASWNGVPVTVGHPKDSSGNDISANQSPQTLAQWQVGTIFNATVESGKLKAEAWVNTDKANSDLIDRLQAMDSMDVSTGYFSDIQGNQYKDIKPDHLALLPNEQGACSYQEGCGVRANKGIKELVLNTMKNFWSNDTDIPKEVKIRLNEKGYYEIGEELQSIINDQEDENTYVYVEDVYDSYFIYCVDGEGKKKHYRRSYSVSADDEVMVGEQITEVDKEINYEPVTNNKGDTDMVEDLIANEASPFTEDDKDSLEAMSECTLTSLSEKYEDQEDTDAPETQEEEKEQSVLSNEDKEALEVAREIAGQEREKYIAHITANSSFEQDSLKEKSTKDLKELATNINPTANFAGRAMGQPKANGKQEKLKPITQATKEHFENKDKEVN